MAGVIKARTSGSERTPPMVATFNFDDVTARAQTYLETVKQQAAEILQRAQEEAAECRRQAEAQGRQAAMAAATAAVNQNFEREIATLLPALRQAVQTIHEAEIAWRQHWEKYAFTLAMAVAERILRTRVESAPEISLTWVREALELAGSAGQIRILMNPQDHQVLKGHTTELLRELGKLAKTEIVPDPSLARGGCRVVTEFGEVDATLETQLARLREELAV